MDPGLMQWGVAALALFLGFMMQAAVGFGSGLLSIPILLWAGIALPEAVAMLLVAVFVQTAWGCWRFRAMVPWKSTGAIAGIRVLAVPVGLWAMVSLDASGLALTKQVIGGVLAAIVLVQWVAKVKPKDSLHPGWLPLAAFTSGVMASAVGMGGPPVVLWTMAHDWPSAKSRAFLWSLFLTWAPVHLPVLAYWYGDRAVGAMGLGLVMIPAVLAGSRIGEWLGKGLNRDRLRVAAYGALLAIAASSILGPITR